jgi:hypothetical protein
MCSSDQHIAYCEFAEQLIAGGTPKAEEGACDPSQA